MPQNEKLRQLGISLVDDLMSLNKNSKGRIEGDAVINLLLKGVGPIIGKRIHERREKLGLSQSALAEALGVKQPEVAKIESGVRAISYESARKLASVLKTNANWILTGRE